MLLVYEQRKSSWSDIQGHMVYLFEEAKGNVLELGVRGGNSTAALVAGVESHGGHVYSVDIDGNCWGAVPSHPQWTFIHADSLDDSINVPAQLDVLFIDTDHTYQRTLGELELWGARVKTGGKILLHDIEHPNHPGVKQAVDEYCEAMGRPFSIRHGSFGLGVISC